ncbi:hypothetical protein AAA173_27545 [Enterocloster aldenensis]|uniref:hypothetical protein n=1 Tax=Enterocloster aldenensis TaxID=358742 RepID=UPI0032C09982
MFSFEGVKPNLGKLAIWRIKSHEAFRGTWLSDYVPNRLGGFLDETPAQKTEEIQMSGEHLPHPEWEGEEVGLDVYKVRVEYEFSCYDENEQEAEGFSNYCVKGVQSKLEELGYCMGCISSKAEDIDMGWLDELESMVFR